MASEELSGGVVVEFPQGLVISETTPGAEGGLRASPTEDAGEDDPLLQSARESSEFTSVVAFELQGGVDQDRLGAMRADDTSEDVVVRLEVEQDEALGLLGSDAV